MKLSKNAKIVAASVGGVLLLCAIIGSQHNNGGSNMLGGRNGGGQLGQLQQQYAALSQTMTDCRAQSDNALDMTRRSVMNGGMPVPPPPCADNFPMWIAQAAVLEKDIHELSTGDHSTQVIDYVPRVQDTSGSVDRYTRQGIRGNSWFRDESGATVELQTAPYYYRDRSSGQLLPSNSSSPPNDGRDYEQLQPIE